MAPPKKAAPSSVAVLDIAPHRSLAGMIRNIGMVPHEVVFLDEFVNLLKTEVCRVGVIAFEALWPDPQNALAQIRKAVGNAKIVVIYSEGGARVRLGHRLWAIGAMDYFVPRASTADDMRQVLRQAWAEAFVQEDVVSPDSTEWQDPRFTQIRLLQNLAASLANDRRVDGLLRGLQRSLPSFLDYLLLQVLVVGESPRLYIFQRQPVDHERIWNLAERMCDALEPITDRPLQAKSLEFIDGAPILTPSEDNALLLSERNEMEVLTLPLISCGEVAGCLGVLAPAGIARDNWPALRLVAHQLATSLRHAQLLEAAQEASLTDPLTGIYNRRYLETILEQEWERVHRYNLQLSAAILDIDHFKRFNEVHGHIAGDAVLQELSRILRRHVRKTDHLIRYGGEEFLILLPETGSGGTIQVVERIRASLSTSSLDSIEGNAMFVTVSAGIASYPTCAARSAEELLILADRALLAAKSSGRNRACIAGVPTKAAEAAQASTEGADNRRYPRTKCELPVAYLPLAEASSDSVIRLSSSNISAGGIALRDPQARLKRNTLGLIYLDDRQDPILTRVQWTGTRDGERHAGLKAIRSSDLFGQNPRGELGSRKKALVLAQNAATLSIVRRVLRSNQYEMISMESGAPEIDPALLDECFLVVIGESDLRGELGRRLLEARQESKNALRIVVINEESDRNRAIQTISSQHVEHFVSPDHNSGESLFATFNKLISDDYFGVRRYLLPGATTRTWITMDAEEKNFVLAGIRKFASDVDCHPRIVDLLITAVDEMLINALYHAGSTEREGKPVSVECGSDGRLLCAAVLDEHGLLNVKDIYKSLAVALEREHQGIPENEKSAHLGFRIMLSTLSQVVINVEPGCRTEIIGIVDLRKSLRDYRMAAPELGIFHKQS